jgi:hypothetical protein
VDVTERVAAAGINNCRVLTLVYIAAAPSQVGYFVGLAAIPLTAVVTLLLKSSLVSGP